MLSAISKRTKVKKCQESETDEEQASIYLSAPKQMKHSQEPETRYISKDEV